ncbi:MAG TPA: AAA family ATPase [Candidatus Limnocylindrales bacterium]
MPVSTTPEDRLRIRVLGPVEVRIADAPVVVDTRKAIAILLLLAVERRPFTRDELAAILWPESDDESARGALRRTLSVLRAALGGRWVRVDRSTVSLDLEATEIDLATVEAAASSDLPGDLRAAAALARGAFLAGFSLRDSPEFDDWRAARAVAVERTIAAVLERLSSAAAASGDLRGAITAASRRLDLNPLDEEARRQMMALLARSGDRTGAIREYRAGVAVLERELGVSPLAETTDLYEAIRDGRFAMPGTDAASADHAAGNGALVFSSTPNPAPVPGPVGSPGQIPRLPLVGRDQELAGLASAHDSSASHGRVAVLAGEAGIGKSRLAETLAKNVTKAGGRILVARAFPAEGVIAYGPIVELLRSGIARPDAASALAGVEPAALREIERLVPLPAGLSRGSGGGSPGPWLADQPAARARLLDALATTIGAFVAGPVPGLIVVEDVQWADDASREALLFLARRLGDRPLLLLLSWRPEDLDDGGERFAAAIERVPDATVVTLGRLGPGEIARLAEAAERLGLRSYPVPELIDESEGLPLYVVEALTVGPAGAASGPPRGVRALLRERLGNVSATAGQLLAAAAVIGRAFDFSTVRMVSGRSEDEVITALEELVRRGLVREVGGAAPGTAFDFGHARLRDAAYEATSLARRRLLHRRVADVLRAAPEGRDDPGRLAQIGAHERAAGRDREAAEAFRQAGARARAVYANREALDHLATALALGHPDVAAIETTIGELRTILGDYLGAITALESAAAVSAEEDLPAIELRLGRVHARRGDTATAASHLDGALDQMDRLGPSADARLLGAIVVERSVVAVRSGDLPLADSLANRALEVGTADGDPRATGAALRLVGLVARARGDLGAARAALTESLALAADDPDPVPATAARNALALVEAAAGDRETAIRLLEEALVICQRTGELHLEAAIENNLADQLHAAGRVEEAMAHLKRAVTLFADIGGRPGELEPEIWKLVTW